MGECKTTAVDHLTKILNNAIELDAIDIRFVNLSTNILVMFRREKIFSQQLYMTTKNYRKILKYIKLEAVLTPFGLSGEFQKSVLTIYTNEKVISCFVSICNHRQFESLILKIIKTDELGSSVFIIFCAMLFS